MRLVVVSTSFAPPADARRRCLESVAAQRREGFSVEHVYLDAAEQNPARGHFENLRSVIAPVSPDTVIVSLDGDDWLGPPDALARVARAHAEGAWVTWGSFVYADGRPGFAAGLPVYAWSEEMPNAIRPGQLRYLPWVTTHLKTYRAGLFQRIDPAHLRVSHGRDLAVMFPCLEMAGPEHSRFIADPLCVYNLENSTLFNGSPAEVAEERAQVDHVRRLPPYARIDAL